jgi:6-phosphofructokinase 2
MPSILTLTMNPALDVSTRVPYVLPDRKLRCDEAKYEPGGGGINVARAIHRLGGEALAWFPIGGPAGEQLDRLLEEEGVVRRTLGVAGSTRENLNVLETVSGRQFRFCMPGHGLTPEEWNFFLEGFRALEPAPDFLVASGSLPPGVPEDFFARLAVLARERGTRFVLDTSGPALACAVEAGVYLLKPSLREFHALMGAQDGEESDLGRLAAEAVGKGWCEALVISLGARGAMLVTKTDKERLAAPTVQVQSGVGAGDSMVAGIVLWLAQGRTLREAVRFGVATGAAAVMNPGTALCRREDAERLLAQVMTAPA